MRGGGASPKSQCVRSGEKVKCVGVIVSVCVQQCHVFLSEPRITVRTPRGEETGLLVGWDRIRGTSVESVCVWVATI